VHVRPRALAKPRRVVQRVQALRGFQAPFDLLPMADVDIA